MTLAVWPLSVEFLPKLEHAPPIIFMDESYIGSPASAPARGRGESGCSEKGEKADIKGFVEGLNVRGALTAIIAPTVYALGQRRPRLRGHQTPAVAIWPLIVWRVMGVNSASKRTSRTGHATLFCCYMFGQQAQESHGLDAAQTVACGNADSHRD